MFAFCKSNRSAIDFTCLIRVGMDFLKGMLLLALYIIHVQCRCACDDSYLSLQERSALPNILLPLITDAKPDVDDEHYWIDEDYNKVWNLTELNLVTTKRIVDDSCEPMIYSGEYASWLDYCESLVSTATRTIYFDF